MYLTETELKQHIKDGVPLSVYVLYGEEAYLSAFYADTLKKKVLGDGDEGFDLTVLDGQECSWEDIEVAAETMPFTTDRRCVAVCDFDFSACGAASDRVLALLNDPPPDAVVIFRMLSVHPDFQKNARWKAFAAAAKQAGLVEFRRKTAAELVKVLCKGAERRGCVLSAANAQLLTERCGDDLQLLTGELDKLCAIAGKGGEVTAEIIRSASAERLEASVFDLSKAIFRQQPQRALEILRRLAAAREEPVAVLAVLSGAFVDAYRVKVAATSGISAEALAAELGYGNKAFRLKYAARDAASYSVGRLRECLDLLAKADTRLKSSAVDKYTVLEQTVLSLLP